MPKGKLDIEALARTLILLGFLVLLIWLEVTKQLNLYVSPTMGKLTGVAGYMLFLLLVVQISCIRPTGRQKRSYSVGGIIWRYIPFLFVLSLAFFIPNATLSATMINRTGLNNQLTGTAKVEEIPRPLAASFHQSELIEINDSNYIEAIREINSHPQDYQGKQFRITGFIYKGASKAPDEFSMTRYVIVCCAADALPVGLYCKANHAPEYREGTWYLAQGVLQMGEGVDKEKPILVINVMQQIEKPTTPYVY